MSPHSLKQGLYLYQLIFIALRIRMPDKRNTWKTGPRHRLFSADNKRRAAFHHIIPFCLIKIWKLFYKLFRATYFYRIHKTFFTTALGKQNFLTVFFTIISKCFCKRLPVTLIGKDQNRAIGFIRRQFSPLVINHKASGFLCKARHKVHFLNFCTACKRLQAVKLFGIFFCGKIINHYNLNCAIKFFFK